VFGSIESAREAIAKLVKRFADNRDHYRAPSYNEETARSDFIAPFFEALGWDVHNRSGAAERYRDCVLEESIKVGDYTKAPDYSFRIGGNKVFFVEAKKPSVDLATDPLPAFQLRRYAYSTKLSLSVLTDFEELAVYDTRISPRPSDKAGVGRVLFWKCEEYLDKLGEIWGLLSKEAVLTGAFDRYAASTKKRGTMPVDAEFLKDIEEWRHDLATNIAVRNGDLTVEDLNFAVQTTIDRIIFLRVAEGQGAEEYGTLLALSNGNNVHTRLVALYRRADQRYNSGLFDFERDRITPSLEIDDKVIKGIVGKLYERSPYDFSAIPVEILGNVYEQFLGRVIHLTKTHQARVEDKPEVKKAGGVFYTPAFVVKHIVDRTLGPLCKGKTPKQMKSLRVLDPACGSGSFLLQAYQLLLDEHLAWYEAHDPASHKREVYLGPGRKWRLTTAEKHAVLLSSVFGVDIDTQAVEVSKLSLLLKVLEGETAQTLRQFGLFGERALPSLEENIKCGNSLIEHADVKELFADEDEKNRINAFDWKKEYPEVFTRGGFDAVVGNPPYIRVQTMQEWAPREVELYKTLYRTAASGNYDIYVVFVEKGLSLLSPSGRLGFILPHKFFNAKYGEGLRELIAKGRHLSEVVHFGDQQVFETATTYTCLLFLEKSARKKPVTVTSVSDLVAWRAGDESAATSATIPIQRVTASDWAFVSGAGGDLLERLRTIPKTLEDVADRIFQGLKTSADKIYIVEEKAQGRKGVRVFSRQTESEYWLEPGLLHPLIKGGDSRRYSLTTTSRLILFPYAPDESGSMSLIPAETLKGRYPLTWHYLSENRDYLQAREGGRMRGDKWYAYIYPKALDVMGLPKIFTPDLAAHAAFSLDETGEVFFTGGVAGGYGLLVSKGHDRLFILGLLNSRLLEWFIRQTAGRMRGGYFSFEARFIRSLPIKTIDPKSVKETAIQADMVRLVKELTSLKKRLGDSKTPHERTQLERQSDAADREIDRLVYGLYGLSSNEIAIVEKETGPSKVQ
jgi:Eco57I restriction-modification methylase/N-6 DNA Methylase/TaqI-like C-terminal specificity domain